MPLDWVPNIPCDEADDLRRRIDTLVNSMGDQLKVIKDVAVTATDVPNKIAHFCRSRPKDAKAFGNGKTAIVADVVAIDERFVYVLATQATTVDVWVIQ